MKIFQTRKGFCVKDISATAKRIDVFQIPALQAVEAPDFVFEGWGYDAAKAGDDRFIKPEVPEGWRYDDRSGTFYKEGTPCPSEIPTPEARLAALEAAMLAMMGGADHV